MQFKTFICTSLLLLILSCAFGQEDKVNKIIEKTPETIKSQIKEIIENKTLVVSLNEDNVKSSIETYDFLLDNLPFTSAVVRTLKLGKYVIKQDNEKLLIDDKQGVEIRMNPFYKEKGVRLYLTEGEYRTSILPPIRGKAFIILQYEKVKDTIKTQATIYFRIENEFINLVKGLIMNILKAVIKEKCGLFIYAAKGVAELVHSDAKKVYEKIKNSALIKEADLEKYKKKYLDEKVIKSNR